MGIGNILMDFLSPILQSIGPYVPGEIFPHFFITDNGPGLFENSLVSALFVTFLACIIGYYVVWSVTPALHSPLMGVTNAISSVIIVGAILAAGPLGNDISKVFGIIGVVLASINIFGGFIVTYRMLSMFKKKPKKEKKG